jgi:hypothetical protein
MRPTHDRDTETRRRRAVKWTKKGKRQARQERQGRQGERGAGEEAEAPDRAEAADGGRFRQTLNDLGVIRRQSGAATAPLTFQYHPA